MGGDVQGMDCRVALNSTFQELEREPHGERCERLSWDL